MTTTTQLLRHVVLFKFTETSMPSDVQAVVDAFGRLPQQIDTIHGFEWGVDVSVENLAQGFTHCFIVTFRHAADRDAYLPHPAHQAFVNQLRPHLAKVLVFDFWTPPAGENV